MEALLDELSPEEVSEALWMIYVFERWDMNPHHEGGGADLRSGKRLFSTRPDIKNKYTIEFCLSREAAEIDSTGKSYRSAGIFEFTVPVDHIVVTRLRNRACNVSEIGGAVCRWLHRCEPTCDNSSSMEEEEERGARQSNTIFNHTDVGQAISGSTDNPSPCKCPLSATTRHSCRPI
jgi:hypothetical protein